MPHAYRLLCGVKPESERAVVLSKGVRAEFAWWAEELRTNEWVELRREGEWDELEPVFLMVADASTTGWGSVLFKRAVGLSKKPWCGVGAAWGKWSSTHGPEDMQCLELLAAEKGLLEWESFLKKSSFAIVGDNVAAQFALKNGRAANRWAGEITRRVRVMLRRWSRPWRLLWCPTWDMPADVWSRKSGAGKVALHDESSDWQPQEMRAVTDVR
jgi:hypothetical protein